MGNRPKQVSYCCAKLGKALLSFARDLAKAGPFHLVLAMALKKGSMYTAPLDIIEEHFWSILERLDNMNRSVCTLCPLIAETFLSNDCCGRLTAEKMNGS
jgi:hypothetical protein